MAWGSPPASPPASPNQPNNSQTSHRPGQPVALAGAFLKPGGGGKFVRIGVLLVTIDFIILVAVNFPHPVDFAIRRSADNTLNRF